MLCFPEILIVFVWDWGPGFRDYLRRDCAHVNELGFLKVKLQIGLNSYVFKVKVNLITRKDLSKAKRLTWHIKVVPLPI